MPFHHLLRNSHIILRPTNFRSDLNKLYSIQENEAISPAQKESAGFGILSTGVLKALWQESDEHYPMQRW